MASPVEESATSPTQDKRVEQFRADVADLKLRSSSTRGPGVWRAIGALLMVAGVVVAFIAYGTSLSMSDFRNIQSTEILAIAFLAVAVIGAALYIAASVASTLRLWLLRQLYEGQSHADQIAQAIRDRKL